MIVTRTLTDGTKRYDVRVGRGPRRTFTKQTDALEFEGELKRNKGRHAAGLETAKPAITYGKLVELWEAAYAPSPWRLSMVEYSRARWRTTPLQMIQPEQLGPWIASVTGQKGKELSEKTRAHILETMRQVLNAGVEWGYLTKSPARRGAFKAPSKRARRTTIQPFETWAEVEAVADACAALNPIAGPLVRFGCATGLRCPGELVELRWSDVDLDSMIVRVGSKTDAGHRSVPISQNALLALGDLPRALSGYVFVGKRGGKFDYANWRDTDWRFALDSCGLPHRPPYEMRHTFATLALAHGASIDDVATVMGHEDISVAFNYYRKWIRAMADRLRSTLNQIGDEDGRAIGRADSRS